MQARQSFVWAQTGTEILKAEYKVAGVGLQGIKSRYFIILLSKGNVTIFMLVYVDDIIVVSSTPEATTALLQDLNKKFALNDLGDLHYFLGIEVNRVQDGIILSQGKYAVDVLKRVGMSECKAVTTPLPVSEKLSMKEIHSDQLILHSIEVLSVPSNISIDSIVVSLRGD